MKDLVPSQPVGALSVPDVSAKRWTQRLKAFLNNESYRAIEKPVRDSSFEDGFKMRWFAERRFCFFFWKPMKTSGDYDKQPYDNFSSKKTAIERIKNVQLMKKPLPIPTDVEYFS